MIVAIAGMRQPNRDGGAWMQSAADVRERVAELSERMLVLRHKFADTTSRYRMGRITLVEELALLGPIFRETNALTVELDRLVQQTSRGVRHA
jgi:hypothetical protein